jgi:hypothetical protein
MAQFNPQAANNMPPPMPPPPSQAASDIHPPLGTTSPSVLAQQAAEGRRGAAWRLLYRLMKNDPQAIVAISSLDDDRLAQYMLEFLALDTWGGKTFVAPPSVRSAIARTRMRTLFLPASGMNQARAERVLQAALHDKRSDLRANAIYILGLIGNRNITPTLLEALRDPVEAVRIQAVRALGHMGDPTVVPALLHILHTADEQMGSQIFLALMDLGSLAAPALIAESANPSAWVRWHCIRVLGEICDDRALPVLVRALADSDHAVVWMAAKSLRDYDKMSIQPVLNLLIAVDTSPWLIEATSYVLREQCLRHKELKPYLEPVLQNMQHVGTQVGIPASASQALTQLRAHHLLSP